MDKHYLKIIYTSYSDVFEEFVYSYDYKMFDNLEDATIGKQEAIKKSNEFKSYIEYQPMFQIVNRNDLLKDDLSNFENMSLGQFMELIK